MGYIREVKETEYSDAMEMIWRVFLKFNAPDYSMEGVNNFRKFLTDETLYKLYLNKDYRVFAFFAEDKIEGVISLRNDNHISLLFVSEKYQNRGVGTALLNYLSAYCMEYEGQEFITVNAAPNAVDFYRGYGFIDMDMMKESDGIVFTPMKFSLPWKDYKEEK